MAIRQIGVRVRTGVVKTFLKARGMSRPAMPLGEAVNNYKFPLNSSKKNLVMATGLTIGVGLLTLPVLDMFSPVLGNASNFMNALKTGFPQGIVFFGGAADAAYFGVKGVKNSWRFAGMAKSVLKLDPANASFTDNIKLLNGLNNADQTLLVSIVSGRNLELGKRIKNELGVKLTDEAKREDKKNLLAEKARLEAIKAEEIANEELRLKKIADEKALQAPAPVQEPAAEPVAVIPVAPKAEAAVIESAPAPTPAPVPAPVAPVSAPKAETPAPAPERKEAKIENIAPPVVPAAGNEIAKAPVTSDEMVTQGLAMVTRGLEVKKLELEKREAELEIKKAKLEEEVKQDYLKQLLKIEETRIRNMLGIKEEK